MNLGVDKWENYQIIKKKIFKPAIVKAMENDEEFKNEIKEMVNGVLGVVGETG